MKKPPKPRAEWDSICYREVVRLAVRELIPFEQIEPFKRLATLLDLKVNNSLSCREQEVSFNERERLLGIINKLAKKRGYQIRLGIFDETSLETFLDRREREVRENIAKEIESTVDTVLGYIGDETEELAAKNRWKILKPKWMNQAIEGVRKLKEGKN